jgi:sigma-B regulation protein RsbU (phosphoserine phosphatase)
MAEQRAQAQQQAEADAQRQAELEQELHLARDIQQGLLLAAVPYLRGWELSAVSMPARDLGGDLYDFLPLPDGRQAIMIGDVSGKGLPAALRMAVARTVFRHEARQGDTPGSTMAAVNNSVCVDIPQGMVTMLYLVLDPEGGEVRFANAGHTYPILLDRTVEELEMVGIPLGVDAEMDYSEVCLTVEPGASLFLYTDGITEATNAEQVMFGERYLMDLLAQHAQLKPRALMKLLLHELRAWTPGNMQDDDITMVILRRRFAEVGRELRSIADDVLDSERAAAFWAEHITLDEQADTDSWADALPAIAAAARKSFNRGLARELSQQFRLVIEDYRGGAPGETS